MGPRQIDKEVLISDASVNYVNFQTPLTRGQVYYWHLTVAALRKYLKLTAWFNNIRWSQLSVLFMHKSQTSSLHKIPCASGCIRRKGVRVNVSPALLCAMQSKMKKKTIGNLRILSLIPRKVTAFFCKRKSQCKGLYFSLPRAPKVKISVKS